MDGLSLCSWHTGSVKIKNMERPFIIILTFLMLNACFKEDERVKPYAGKVTIIHDSVQVYQSYFDFETGRVIKTFSIHDWQLGFECGPAGWHIMTNSGDNWFVYNTGQNMPDALVNMPKTVDHLYDVPSDFPDSTAVGNWVDVSESGNVYTRNIYLLGYFHASKFNLIKQLVFTAVDDTSYQFYYKDQDSGISDTVTIVKNDAVKYVYYNFRTHQQVSLEPDQSVWDLAFGPYYDLATLFGATIPYQVGGSFINAGQTEAVLDSITPFEEISVALVTGYSFVSQRDIPGYRWKVPKVDVTGGGSASYTVKANYNYIVHTAPGFYYKLKFLSYSHNGYNGFPQFEYVRLE
jgi:hypothetical protein